MLSHVVIQGNNAVSWNSTSRSRSGPAIGAPSSNILPRVGCSKPASRRVSVDLPQPDGPTITVSFARSMVNVQSRTTSLRRWSAPYELLPPWTEISPGTMAGRGTAALMSAAGPRRGCSPSGGSAAAKRLSAGVVSSSLQPWRRVAAQPAQQLARRKAGNADRDHADDDLFVRAADVRIPDEEAESAAGADGAARAAARDHLGRHDDLPRNAHADSGADDDRRQRAGQDDAPEDVPARRAHRLRSLE